MAVVRDGLAAGMDWWALSGMASMHPQAACTEFGRLLEGVPSPAQQRPHLAMVLTAGLAGVHDLAPEYGVDVEYLGLL